MRLYWDEEHALTRSEFEKISDKLSIGYVLKDEYSRLTLYYKGKQVTTFKKD